MEPVEDLVERVLREALGVKSNNTQVVRVEGMGSMWHGIAIGIALGATIAGVVWISTKLQAQDIAVNQAEAYHQAVYALSPRFAAEIDRELQKQQESRRVHANPDHHRTDAPADDAPAESTAAPASR